MVKRAAFSVWNSRIAPVFDVAQTIVIIEADKGQIISQQLEEIKYVQGFSRAEWLKDKSVSALVCGAISRSLEEVMMRSGIDVNGFISGEIGQVMDAWLRNENLHELFAMPGCMCRQRLRVRGSRNATGRIRRCRMD